MNKENRMLPRDAQLAIEYSYSRKHIDGYIKSELLDDSELVTRLDKGVSLIENWLQQDYFDSKNKRLAQLQGLNLRQLVLDIYTGTCYCVRPELYTSITSQLASRLKFDDRRESIQTVAEIVAVLAETDVYDIFREGELNQIYLRTNVSLTKKLHDCIRQSSYLPPMVCKPDAITSNNQSPYLTFDESVILKNNHHSDEVSLDVLNIQNQTPLKIDMDFIRTVEEEPTFELDTIDKVNSWNVFKSDSRDFYALMSSQTDEVYLTHRYDKRGRCYASGYYLSTMGTAYKKASLEFSQQEHIEVPKEYRL